MENQQKTAHQGSLPYEKPQIEIIALDDTPQLLAQSGGANRGDYTSKKW